MGGGAEGWYWYEGAVGMVCEVELDGDRGRFERRRCLMGKIWEC